MNDSAAVITISDKGARGERIDTSGPALCAMLQEHNWSVTYTAIIPDDAAQIKRELLKCTDELGISLILTTGGTGFSPRDITPEAALEVIRRETRGIPEAMRAASMKITDRGCLSRAVAGIRHRSLIVTLPGSEKAATENLAAVLDPIRHGMDMLLGSGSADCAEHHHHNHAPSVEQWLKQAKQDPNAHKVGMYLTHNGVVRSTARAEVRDGIPSHSVTGMVFSCNQDQLSQVIEETKKQPGIFYVRVWVNDGPLNVGDDLMLALVGGDTRPHTVDALQYLIERIKTECVTEEELTC